jgi:alginate O-acetyltransferase complex protein AlgF
MNATEYGGRGTPWHSRPPGMSQSTVTAMDVKRANRYDPVRENAMKAASAFTILLALCAAAPATAETRSVYGPQAPGDAAFIRLVDAIPGTSQLEIEIGATHFEALGWAEVSPYRPVTPDIYQLEAAGNETEIIASSGRYYTVVCTPTAVTVYEDPAHTDPARAQLFLYNLSLLPRIDLRTADGKSTVIAGVRPRSSGLAVVNAVRVPLAVFSGGASIAGLGDLGLERGSSFSIFVLETNQSPHVFTVRARVLVE